MTNYHCRKVYPSVALRYHFILLPRCNRIIKAFSSSKKKALKPDEIAFNFRLSRARRCIENVFGILTAKWRCVRQCLECETERAKTIVKTCIVLHNFLLKYSKENYCPQSFGDHYVNGCIQEGEWRSKSGSLLDPFESVLDDTVSGPVEIRETIKRYINSTHGFLPWSNHNNRS